MRGGGPDACACLGGAILRNSIFYLVPMGSRGGSGLRGGGPEASGASLGRAISRISSTEEAGHIFYISKIIDINNSKRIKERHKAMSNLFFSI